jgi:hypothetical protein
MIDAYPENQNAHLSPRAMADEFGEDMLHRTLHYVQVLRHYKLIYSENYHLRLTPRARSIVNNWRECRRSILAI